MADAALEWGGDFIADASGDLLVIDGDDEVRQRLERRLFTAAGGYVWHPSYGAGLPKKIGSVLSPTQVQSIVVSQLAQEASVATNPPAQISVGAAPNDASVILINIKYWDAVSGETVSFLITA